MSEHLIPPQLIPENKSEPPRRLILAMQTEDPSERIANMASVIRVIEGNSQIHSAGGRPDDIKVAAQIARDWDTRHTLTAGESGTGLRLFSWFDHHLVATGKQGQHHEFERSRTLATRPITEIPEVYGLTQRELLLEDNGTSQFASAAVLTGDMVRLNSAPFRLQQTYDMVDEWLARDRQLDWGAPLIEDATIRKLAESFARLMLGETFDFDVTHSEEVPTGLGFGAITPHEAQQRFSSVLGHESNRIVEMERALWQFRYGEVITSNDHRIIQTLAMLALYKERPVNFRYPECVTKSWPQFWDYLQHIAIEASDGALAQTQ